MTTSLSSELFNIYYTRSGMLHVVVEALDVTPFYTSVVIFQWFLFFCVISVGFPLFRGLKKSFKSSVFLVHKDKVELKDLQWYE